MKKLIALSAAVVLWGAAGVAAALPEESGKREEAAVAATFYDPEAPPEIAGKTPISESQGSKDRQIIEMAEAAHDPRRVVTPGEMWSDRFGLPSEMEKAQADHAETIVAGEKENGGNRVRARQAEPRCRVFWPSPHQVCGAILERYEQLGANLGWLLLPTEPAAVNPDGVGYHQRFSFGYIYWHPDTGAHAVANHSANVWQRHGWEAGWLGYPLGGEVPIRGSNVLDGERNGWVQEFQGGRIYRAPLHKGYTVASINGKILEKWLELGGADGVLGFPTADETGTPDGIGRFSVFQGGSLYWHPQYGAHPVHGGVLDKWAATGYEQGELGYPIADPETEDGIKIKQVFQNGEIDGYSTVVNRLAKALGVEKEGLDNLYLEMSDYIRDEGLSTEESWRGAVEHAEYSLEKTKEEQLRWNSVNEVNGRAAYSRSLDFGARNNCTDEQLIKPASENIVRGDYFYSGGTTTVKSVDVNHGHAGILWRLQERIGKIRIQLRR